MFAPYTDIPANLLFFERGGPTDTIWYCELPLPSSNGVGRKKYSKAAPLQFEEFAAALAWRNDRRRGPQAWAVDIAARRAARRRSRDASVAKGRGATQRGVGPRQVAARTGAGHQRRGQRREVGAAGPAARTEGRAACAQAGCKRQAEGDALHWPIYNLDIRNPNAKAGLEHADPQDLIASMRGHEDEVMRLLGEIEALVNEVQA